jgi:hypothetical protein
MFTLRGVGAYAATTFGFAVARLPFGPGMLGTGRYPDGGVFVAADVHYLASGGARAAAVASADAGFFRLVADRVELVPDVQPCRPGQFCLREFPPLRSA